MGAQQDQDDGRALRTGGKASRAGELTTFQVMHIMSRWLKARCVLHLIGIHGNTVAIMAIELRELIANNDLGTISKTELDSLLGQAQEREGGYEWHVELEGCSLIVYRRADGHVVVHIG